MKHLILGGLIGLSLGYILFAGKKKRKGKGQILLFLSSNNIKIGGIIMSVELKKKQKAVGTLKVVDKNGDPAQFQAGSAKVSVQDESVATASIDENGEITILSQGLGATVLDISVDANLNDDGDATTGDDVTEVKTQIALEVTAGEAVGATVDFTVSDVEEAPAEGEGTGEGQL